MRVVCPSVVGRDGEWSELVQCLDGAAAGRGGLVAVVGEVGVGKTRLTGDADSYLPGRGGRPFYSGERANAQLKT